MRAFFENEMFTAIRAIDKALLIDGQENARMTRGFVTIAGDFAGLDEDCFDGL